MAMSAGHIKKGTVVFLSEIGYYNYYYRSSNCFIAQEDIPIKRIAVEYSEPGKKEKPSQWQAIVLYPENLTNYPDRDANLVWVKKGEGYDVH